MTRIIPGQSRRFRAMTDHLCKMSLPIIAALVLGPIPADADEFDVGITALQGICASAAAAAKMPSALAKPALDGLDSKVMAAVKAAAGAVTQAKSRVFDLGVQEKLLSAKLGKLNGEINFILRDAEKEKARIRSKMDEIQARNGSLDVEIKTLTVQLNGKQQELGVEENKPLLDRTWGPAGKRIKEVQGEIAALEKDIAGKTGEKRDLAGEFSRQQQELSRVDAEWFAKVRPLQMQLPQVDTDLKKAMDDLEAARKAERKASETQTIVEQAAGQSRTCIEQARNPAGGQQRGDAGGGEGGESPIDYAAVGKAVDEYQGSGGNPTDSQGVKKPAVPQGGYQGGAGGLVGKIPIDVGSGMLTPPMPQGSGVRQPGTDWQGLAPQGGTSGGGSGARLGAGGSTPGSPPGPTAKAAPTPGQPTQQSVRVNCYSACFNGCMANKGGSGYFQGMCAPEGPCYPTRVTPDACTKHCAGYKQDVLLNAGDEAIGVCGGGTPGAATNPPAQPATGTASAKSPIACPALCQQYCMGGMGVEAFTVWRSGPKPADLPQKCTSHCSQHFSGVTATEGDTVGGINQCIRGFK